MQRPSAPKVGRKVPILDATRISVSRSNGQRSGLEAVGGIPCRPNPAATRTACYLWKRFTKLESLRPPAVIWCLRRRMCVMDSPALRTSPCWHVRNAARYQFECCRPVISKTTHFRCCIVSDETCNVEWGLLYWFGFTLIDTCFAKICIKNDFRMNFRPKWLWALTFWPKIVLLLRPTPDVGNFRSKFEHCVVSVFDLTVCAWKTDGHTTYNRTDGRVITRNAAS